MASHDRVSAWRFVRVGQAGRSSGPTTEVGQWNNKPIKRRETFLGCFYTVRETTGRDRRRPNICTSLYTYVICIRVLQQTHVWCHGRTNRCCVHWHRQLHVSVNDVQLSFLTQVLSILEYSPFDSWLFEYFCFGARALTPKQSQTY